MDQRIAYYHSNPRCLQNWIPLFIQIISMVRNNAYVVYREHFKSDAITHSRFTLEMIKALMKRAYQYYLPVSRVVKSPSKSKKPAKIYMKSNKRPRLAKHITREQLLSNFPQRKYPAPHIPVESKLGQGSCLWCSVLFKEAQRAGEDVQWDREVRRTSKICGCCSAHEPCYLCTEHFSLFHNTA